MQPLSSTRQIMTWFSMCPANESTTLCQRIGYVAYTLAILFIMVTGLVTSVVYCIVFSSIDFEGALYAIQIAIGQFGLIYFMIYAIQMRQQIDGIFKNLTTIYKSSGTEMALRYLYQANESSERMWSLYFEYTAALLGGMTATSLLSVLYCYLTQGLLNVNQFYRPGKFDFAWDQSTVVGFFAEIFVTISIIYGYLILTGTQLLLFISLCLHHQAFYEIFKHSIDESKQCHAELLRDLIRFHLLAKNWFLDSSDYFSSFVLVQLICGTVWLTVSIFFLDLQIQKLDYLLASVISTTSVGMLVLLFYCYYGKVATESYAKMPDCLFNMHWYGLPIKLQKCFVLMIENMQKPIYYHGFEVATLDLGTFVQLFRKILSYYIAIKAIASK